VLVVDDVLSNRKWLARLLTYAGHRCELTENGQVAVDMILESMECGDPFETVWMDFEMPIMNGPGSHETNTRLCTYLASTLSVLLEMCYPKMFNTFSHVVPMRYCIRER